jgi:hypothetical protein
MCAIRHCVAYEFPNGVYRISATYASATKAHFFRTMERCMIRSLACLIFAAAVPTAVVNAETPQSFSAQVGDIALESGDAEITLVPIGHNFSLSGSTRGASAYPPPKTRIDRLSIVCDGFTEGKALVLDHLSFERSVCDVTFDKGTKPMGGSPDATYHLDKNSAENRFEITTANGKLYEGTFSFRLKDSQGNTISVSQGRFKAEDRQL